MANAATIQARVAFGYAKAATILGPTFTLYRPAGAGAVIVTGNVVTTLPVVIASDARLMATAPIASKDDHAFAGIDATIAHAGDYIVGSRVVAGSSPPETWYVESIDTPSVARVVRCNRVLSFYRPGSPVPGASFYGGDLTATESQLLTQWPSCTVPGTKGEKSDADLPGDTRLPWVVITLPLGVPVAFRAADFAVDDLGQRYLVSQSLASARGLYLTASLVVT